MINAIIKNKVPRDYVNEDSQTSFVFELMSYLPRELFGRILRNSINQNLLNIDFTTLYEISFWPHWNSHGTDNTNHVEPDVFIQFDEYDILIEAKKYDENQQDPNQWKKQIRAYQNEYGEDNKTLIFIALGGIWKNKAESLTVNNCKYTIVKCRWASILNSVKQVQKEKEIEQPTRFVLANLIVVFQQIFEFLNFCWFESLEYEKLSEPDKSINFFVKEKVFGGLCE